MIILKRIKELRIDHDLKQINVATKLGVAVTIASNYENGNRDIPNLYVFKLSNFYNISVGYLLSQTIKKQQ